MADTQGAGATPQADDLLTELSSHGVLLRSRRGRLVVDAPAGTPGRLMDRLNDRREATLEAIAAHPGLSGPRLARVASTGDAFGLTDLQGAYLVGETEFPELRTAAFVAHAFEVPKLDPDRLRRALLAVLDAHEMLRVRVEPSGLQRVLDVDPGWRPQRVDWRNLDAAQAREALREEARAQPAGLPLSAGPQLGCIVYQASDTWFVLLRLRLFVLDAHSIGLVSRDLAAAYRGIALGRTDTAGTFERYVKAVAEHRGSQAYRNAVAHWRRRRTDLPGEPRLPLTRPPEHARFDRVRHHTSPKVWRQLQQRARDAGLSVNTVLCAAYADVLRRWASGQERFCLTVLVSTRSMLAPQPFGSDRQAPPPAVDECVGNFGSTLLLEYDGAARSFRQRAAALQQRLMDDLTHSWVSGVEVARGARRADRDTDVGSRFVFASGLDAGPKAQLPPHLTLDGWQLVTKSMHTPQVLLDHQVSVDDGRLVATFDHVVQAFPAGLVTDLAAAHADLLARLAQDDEAWSSPEPPPLSDSQLRARRAANATYHRFPPAAVLDRLRAPTEAIAIRGDGVELTYRQAADRVWRLAAAIGSAPPPDSRGPLVGVLDRKGPRQYLAALAVIASGRAYVPLGLDWPPQRIGALLSDHGITQVVAAQDGARLLQSCGQGAAVIPIDAMDGLEPATGLSSPPADDPDRLAYVIFTSGSTGVPKGVAIPHRGLMNTVQDLTERFGLNPHDRFLSLSELSFDLSAFDLFGALHSGGTVVIPPLGPIPDPDLWAHWLQSTRATVWNTVPALLEMLLDHLGDRAGEVLSSLRLVLLSGDWVPLSLPGRVRSANPAATVVALGGATEASIWSNFHVVTEADPAWPSVPYGKPLANQRFHVLDEKFQDCPTWVPGELYIAGDGLAAAYYGQSELTATRFPIVPRLGERLYRTGDHGRYWPDGTLEFLGRHDRQVKVRGYRVDLSEVEQRLAELPGVQQAACVVVGTGSSSRLVAFTVPNGDGDTSPSSLRAALARTLPSYAVPTSFHSLSRLPLTGNGKRDGNRLRELAAGSGDDAEASPGTGSGPGVAGPPRTPRERTLARLWAQVCRTPVRSVDDDFFTIGGSSISAVQLLRLIEDEFGVRLPLSSLFEASTVSAQVSLLESWSDRLLVPITAGQGAPIVLVHPVGGHLLGYRELVDALPTELAVHGLQSPRADELPGTLEALAEREAREVAALNEPVHLVGWSLGGVLAGEIARQLATLGWAPLSLTVIDSFVAEASASGVDASQSAAAFFADHLGQRAGGRVDVEAPPPGTTDPFGVLAARYLPDEPSQRLRDLYAQYAALHRLLLHYTPRPLPALGVVQVVNAAQQHSNGFPGLQPLIRHPGRLIPANAEVTSLPATHFSIVRTDAARVIGGLLQHLTTRG